MNIDIYTGGMAATNAYLVEINGQYILFDAPEGVYQWLQDRKIQIAHLILTHQHWDHSHDTSHFQEAEIWAFDPEPKEEITLIESFKSRYGIQLNMLPYQIDQVLVDQQKITLCGAEFMVYHVPGHSPDSIAFYCPKEQMCISGDVLFLESCGRIDLPGGNAQSLIHSIEEVLFKLPPETTIFPGHGPETTIGEEKKRNPYKTIG